MPNPACKTCVPNKPETHDSLVSDIGCKIEYDQVKVCMDNHGGNIGSCKEEWTTFRTVIPTIKK